MKCDAFNALQIRRYQPHKICDNAYAMLCRLSKVAVQTRCATHSFCVAVVVAVRGFSSGIGSLMEVLLLNLFSEISHYGAGSQIVRMSKVDVISHDFR